jgi:two-component system, OmpR family, sensor histidine kinase VicK
LRARNEETSITEDPQRIVEENMRRVLASSEVSVSILSVGMQFSYDYFFQTKKIVLVKHKKGEHKGMRFITFIDKDNIGVVKNYLNSGARLRHVKKPLPMSFGISYKQTLTTVEKMGGGKAVQNLLKSNDVIYIKFCLHFQ